MHGFVATNINIAIANAKYHLGQVPLGILKSYKFNLLFNLLHKAFKPCSNFEHFHQGINMLKTIFKNNGYRKSFL